MRSSGTPQSLIFCPPFSFRGLLMGANHSAIEHEILIVRIARQILKDPLPHARFGLPSELLMHGFLLAITLRQVVPVGTRADHRKNRIHEQRLSVPVRPGSEALPAIRGLIRTHCFLESS
jgi:hypothetical protein